MGRGLLAARLFLGISLTLTAGFGGCAGSKGVPSLPPNPIPGIDRVTSITVLPVRFVLMRAGSSRPEPESTVANLQLTREIERILKQEIERRILISRYKLAPLHMSDSTLQRKPWLARMALDYRDNPDQVLRRAIALPDSAPSPGAVDILDFVVDSMETQHLLFVQGFGSSISTGKFATTYIGEEMSRGISDAIGGAIFGKHHMDAPTDAEQSSLRSSFFLEARLVDIEDARIL